MLNETESNENDENPSFGDNEMNNSRKRKSESDDNESSFSDETEDEEESEEGSCDEEETATGSSSEQVTDSEEYDSEEEEESSDEERQASAKASSRQTCAASSTTEKSKAIVPKEIHSDSSEGNVSVREICAICLSRMKGEIGSPELCDHSFCLECLLEWAKTNNSCPQDRTQFLQIFVRKKVKGKIIRSITVEEAKPDDIHLDDDEEPTFCEVCGRCDREDTLLLCDGCDSGHHLECLNPPLNSVPVEEWFCPECQVVNNHGRVAQEVSIEVGEVADLLEDGGLPQDTLPRLRATGSPPRRLPRTRASERIRRRITRARISRPNVIFSEPESDGNSDESDSGHEVSSSVRLNLCPSDGPPKKKLKLNVRKTTKKKTVKRKTTRKTRKRKTKKRKTTKKKTKRKTTVKRKSSTKSRRKRKTVRKTASGKKRKLKSKIRKGKKKSVTHPVVTPKARLAEALGIKPMKNPWQLSVPAMTGVRSQGDTSLTSQRWRAGVPSLSLLGSNSELDYISEPDEYGDAILTAGVRLNRRVSTTSAAIARRKALTARTLLSQSIITPNYRNLCDKPISDSNVSSVSDLLENIIESQSLLHQIRRPISDGQEICTDIVKNISKGGQEQVVQMGVGPNSPSRNGDSNEMRAGAPRNQNNASHHYSASNPHRSSDNFATYSFGRSSNCEDPTGSKAYSSYLRSYSDEGSSPVKPPYRSYIKKDDDKKRRNDDKKKVDDDDFNLYSDVEPEFPTGVQVDDDDDDEDEDAEDKEDVEMSNKNIEHRNENDTLTSDDELIIDDGDKHDAKEREEDSEPIMINTSGSTYNDNEVGSSTVPGINDFELEAVSDTDTHEMDKSINSSISLSDSNMGDAEVTSSTHDVNTRVFDDKAQAHRIVQMYGSRGVHSRLFNNSSSLATGLVGLETENISDNEEMCFEDNYDNEDNIEEGEIPSEKPPQALPANRPKINIQLRKVIEVSSPNKEFGDGDYEEGEIVDEAAARKKREKARKEVEEIVNQPLEDEEQCHKEADKENVTFKQLNSASVLSDPVFSSPEKVEPLEKSWEKEKSVEKEEKEPEKSKEIVKDKDISFKKVSRNNKVRNYRDNDKSGGVRSGGQQNRERGHSKNREDSRERVHSRDRGHSRERGHSRDRDHNRYRDKNRERGRSVDRYKGSSNRRKEKDKKREPKRKEMERYNVRQMITKKEEERKKKDEFGRDVALREVRPSRSRSRGRKRSVSRGRRKSFSRSASRKKGQQGRNKKSYSRSPSRSRSFLRRARRKRSYSSSSTSSSSSSSSTSSSYSSSTSSSQTPRSKRIMEKKRLRSRSKSKSLVKKKVAKKKPLGKPKEKPKKPAPAVPKKKEEKKKEKQRKEKEGLPKEVVTKPEKQKKKRKRDKSPLQSKEVYQAGGSIMVSVNFSRNAKENKEGKKKKEKDAKLDADPAKRKKQPGKRIKSPFQNWSLERRSVSPGGKHTPLQDEPMWSPGNIHHSDDRVIAAPKTPEVIDLDIIMVTPPPQEPILISDSEEEDEGITRLPPDLGVQQMSPLSRNQGPKTPPEPGVKFTLSTKQALKPINNPLQDEEEEDRSAVVASRGPNTPPGPPPESDESVGRPKSPVELIPRSPVETPPASSPEPDAYDPFEPTKSPSPLQRSPQQEARVSSSDQADQSLKSPSIDSSPVKIISPAPPPLPTEPPQTEEKPPEPQKAPEDEASSSATALPPPTAAAVVPISVAVPVVSVSVGTSKQPTLPGVVSLTTAPPVLAPVSTVAQPLNTMQQLFAGLPANVASILYPAALAAVAARSAANASVRPQGPPVIPPDFSRPPPTTAIMTRPPPVTISPVKIGDKSKVTQNGQGTIPLVDVIDMDLGSPTSPDSSDVSDIFDPPSPHSTHVADKTSPRKHRQAAPQKTSPTKVAKPMDRFDVLFGDSRPKHQQPSHKSKSRSVVKMDKIKNLMKRSDNDDDIPSSAVDLQVKEKLLKKVQRQERVVEEVKLCLKPFYNKKTITKEDYKEIMKKCVQKVCHNRSGEINANKIRALVEGYIKKVKYYRKKQVGSGGSTALSGGLVMPPTASDPPPPGFGLISKAHTMKLKP